MKPKTSFLNPLFLLLALISLGLTHLVLELRANPLKSAPTGEEYLSEQKEKEMRELMQTWSRQLGVTCSACHDIRDFKKPDLKNFQVAKEHHRIVKKLNEEFFIETSREGKPLVQADCYMCHRGQLKPDYKESAKKNSFW